MRGRPPRPFLSRGSPGRAALGVLALYALLLRAFLGLAAPAPLDPLGPAGAVLCADHGGGDGGAGDAGTGDGTAHADCHPCCTLAHVPALGAPPPVAAAVPWPRAPYARLAWRPEASAPKTGPPVHAASARGPPPA